MATKKIRKAPKEALVILAWIQGYLEGLNLSDKELADFAGCARTSIYRMPVFQRIRANIRALGKADLLRGSKNVNHDSYEKTTSVEAFDPNHPMPKKHSGDDGE
jgi:hypothetical protein